MWATEETFGGNPDHVTLGLGSDVNPCPCPGPCSLVLVLVLAGSVLTKPYSLI